jgi:hypothetical protein
MNLTPVCRECGSKCPNTETFEGSAECKKGHLVKWKISETLQNDRMWDQCPVCNAFDAYSQKDLPKKLMLGLLIVFFILILWLLSVSWIYGIACLLGLTLIDAALYFFLPSILVCYSCGSEIRNHDVKQKIAPFDHHVFENYRKT